MSSRKKTLKEKNSHFLSLSSLDFSLDNSQAVHRFATERTVEEAVASLAAARAGAIGSGTGGTIGAAAAATGRGRGAKAAQTLSVGDVSALLGLDR